jgi:hypothetical protein
MRRAIWITLAVIVVGYLVYAVATVDRRSDQAQVESLFANAAESVQKRDISGTLALVSENYKDNSGRDYNNLRLIVAQALRTDLVYKVSYKIKKTTLTDTTATAVVNMSLRAINNSLIYGRDFTVVLTKEPGRHALVVPIKTWRVTNIDDLGLQFEGGF